MAPKRGRIIHALGRTWRHQQARSLLDALGASGDVKVACVWGLWYADVHYRGAQCFDNVGHGLTLWTALADYLDPLATNEGWLSMDPYPYPNYATTHEPEPLQAAPVLCRLDLWHTWSRWADRGNGTVTTAKGGEVDVIVQDRVCLRCGKRDCAIGAYRPG